MRLSLFCVDNVTKLVSLIYTFIKLNNLELKLDWTKEVLLDLVTAHSNTEGGSAAELLQVPKIKVITDLECIIGQYCIWSWFSIISLII